MKLNDFIAELNALQKTDLNPEVFVDIGSPVCGMEFIEGEVVILTESIEPTEWEEEPEEVEPLKIPPFKM
jgi:hypothetical protein